MKPEVGPDDEGYEEALNRFRNSRLESVESEFAGKGERDKWWSIYWVASAVLLFVFSGAFLFLIGPDWIRSSNLLLRLTALPTGFWWMYVVFGFLPESVSALSKRRKGETRSWFEEAIQEVEASVERIRNRRLSIRF